MGFWDKSRQIFKCLCENATQSIRCLAKQTGLSKSSVHRLKHAMARRDVHPESWMWETEDGRHWLRRLVVATLYTFGLKRGVGVDTISEFLARLHLEMQVGCSPTALRGVMQALETAVGEIVEVWEKAGCADGEEREIIGAVDETFFEQMILVFMDLKTGYLLREEVAEDRTYCTWKALVDERLQALNTHVLYVVSDRAKALIQLAEQGLECLSIPDLFHCMHEIVKSYSLALGRRVRQAHTALAVAQEALARLQGRPDAAHEVPEAMALVEIRQAEVARWAEGHDRYRHFLETLSCTLHPFSIADSAPQTSCQVASQLQTVIDSCPRGCLVARRPAGFSTIQAVASVATVGTCVPPADGLLGAPGISHPVSSTESQDTGGLGNSTCRVYPACHHPAAGATRPRGVARVGDRPRPHLSAGLLGSRRTQRLFVADASQPPRRAQAPLQGVDRVAQLRLSRCRWDNTSYAVLPPGIPRPL